MTQQIILRNLKKPVKNDLKEDLTWLSNSLGFSTGRDLEKTSQKILQKVLEETSNKGSTSTEKLAEELKLSIQRVNYHLRTLIESGFLHREKRQILIRQGSVKSAIEEMRKDANRTFDNLSAIAEDIDEALGLESRK